MTKKIIFVLGGGSSSEREVSEKSAKFVYGEISRQMYDVYLVMLMSDRWFAVMDNGAEYEIDKNDFSFNNGRKVKPDSIINIIHGTPGENGLLQGYFDLLKIHYLGCSSLVSALTFDKVWCKRVVAEYGITMAKDFILHRGEEIDTKAIVAKLGLPIFVKPSNSGSSFGVTKVKREEDIPAAVEKAYTEDGVVIIEEAIDGREMACGVYITAKGEHFLPVTEIISKNEFFDYEAKYNGASNEVTPAQINETVRAKLQDYCLMLYKVLRCHGLVRVDFIVRDETPYFIEINTIPGMSSASIVPQQLTHAGITVNELFTDIMEN